MEMLGTNRVGDTTGALEEGDKAFGRFRVVAYMEEYTPSWTNTFRHRAELLWNIIVADKKGHNEPSWALCCFTLERKKVKGQLGHPKESLIPVCRLFTQEQIQSQEAFHEYLARHLPKNEHRDTRLPQINMRHQQKKEEHLESSEQAKELHQQQRNAEKTESRLIFLEAMLDDLARENHMLKAEMKVSRSHQAMKDSFHDMDERFDTLNGRMAVSLLHQQKQNRMIEVAEQTRQEANAKQTEHCFELRSMIDKLSDRFDVLEEKMPNEALNKSLQMSERSRRYDPEMLDQYTLNWKSLNENYGTYYSPISQLKGLKKRAPEDK